MRNVEKVIVRPSPCRRRMVVAIKKKEGDLRTEREHDLVITWIVFPWNVGPWMDPALVIESMSNR